MTNKQKYYLLKFLPNLFFEYIFYIRSKRNIDFENEIKGKNNVYIFGACDYANLGDYAITLAQKEMLKYLFPLHEIQVINMDETFSKLKSIKRLKNTNDIITIIGGGNMGDLYYGYERKRNFIIRKLHDYKIISFPQSIFFSNTKLGKLAKKRTISEYNKHNNFSIFAREKLSYSIMSKIFKNNHVILSPDIVFTLDYRKKIERHGIIISVRNDKESCLSIEQKNYIGAIGKQYKITYLDTIPHNTNNLSNSFNYIIESYSSAELIITDRLHGMIFSYITGTPAIIIPNNNGKIKYSFEWIKDCDYIKLIKPEELTNIDEYIQIMKSKHCDNIYFDNKRKEFMSYFSIINN